MTTSTASVTLSTVWINLASTLSNYQSFDQMSALQVDTNQPGEVRTYAGGRLRLVTTAGVARTATITIQEATRDQINWLQTYVGQTVLVRDDRGRKIWGTFLTPKVTENQHNGNGDVTIVVNEITYVEAV
jgi:hypothetical protein